MCCIRGEFITDFSGRMSVSSSFSNPAARRNSLPAATTAPTIAPTSPPSPTATTVPPAASIKPVTIKAFCTLIGEDPIVKVPGGTPVIITWGWEAKTEAQINDFLDSDITTITLDGKTLEGTRAGGIVKNTKSGQPEVVWYAEVGVLNAGKHIITFNEKWKKMIYDGSTTYGPGGKIETQHDECQVNVQ